MTPSLIRAINDPHRKLGKRQFRQASQAIENANRFAFLLPGRIAPGKEIEAQELEKMLNNEFRSLRAKGYSRSKAADLTKKMNIILIRRVLK